MDIDRIRQIAKDICSNQDSPYGNMWREPLVASATIDERFEILPRIASPKHDLPHDLLPTGRTVLIFFVPFQPEIVESNIPSKHPSRRWAVGKTETNALIKKIGEAIESSLSESGFASYVTPPTYNYDQVNLMAQWSHKHLGYIAGLGRFGINAQLITPAGCAGRMGSLVTEADLGNHPLVHEAELCLEKRGLACSRCIKNCPVGAVSMSGIDRTQCNQRLQAMKKRLSQQEDSYDRGDVCAKCVAGMPCSLCAPTAR